MPPMEVRLVLVAPPKHARALSVALPAVIGRSSDAALQIPQESVSRRHCEVFASEGRVFVRDLGSTNGTRIGTEKISANAAIAIEPGSVIRVGEATFRVEFTPVATSREAPAGVIVEDPLPLPDAADIPELPLPAEPLPDLPSVAEADGVDIELPGGIDAADMPALPDAFATMTETVEQPPTGFEFIAPDDNPPATNDASLDDFLKGLQ